MVRSEAILPGGVIDDPGSTVQYRTVAWRLRRPVINNIDRCTGCLLCWVFCPEPAVIRRSDGKVEFDYEHCKGCGICALECPPKVIVMVDEDE